MIKRPFRLYDKGKSVKENLNISGPLLSRFDLVFILQDSVNKKQDNRISSSIMNLYRGKSAIPVQQKEEELVFQEAPESLYDRLRWVGSFQKQALPLDVIRDYISYAREYCKPKLSRAAANVLKEYFMSIRYGNNTESDVAITTRQLEALIRLSQARAKAAMRDFVLVEDAFDVVELMRHSVMEVHMDQNGEFDRTRGGAGGSSQKKLLNAFTSELRRHLQQLGWGNECNFETLRQVAEKISIPSEELREFIQKLRDNGLLLRTSSELYQLVS